MFKCILNFVQVFYSFTAMSPSKNYMSIFTKAHSLNPPSTIYMFCLAPPISHVIPLFPLFLSLYLFPSPLYLSISLSSLSLSPFLVHLSLSLCSLSLSSPPIHPQGKVYLGVYGDLP